MKKVLGVIFVVVGLYTPSVLADNDNGDPCHGEAQPEWCWDDNDQDDLQSDINQNTDDIDSLDTRVKDNTNSINDNQLQIDDIDQNAKDRSQRVHNAAVKRDKRKVDKGTFSDDQQRQDTDISTNRNNINNNDKQIGAHTVRLEHHSTQLQDHEQRINRLEDRSAANRRGIALAIATASHHFEVGPNAPVQMSLSGGYYEGENALSLGFGGQVSRNLFISGNAGATNSGRETSVGVNATWSFR